MVLLISVSHIQGSFPYDLFYHWKVGHKVAMPQSSLLKKNAEFNFMVVVGRGWSQGVILLRNLPIHDRARQAACWC